MNALGMKLKTHILGTDQIIRGKRSNFLEFTSTHNSKYATVRGLLLTWACDYLAEDSLILPGTWCLQPAHTPAHMARALIFSH